jgi:hypothetical protein
MKSLGRFIACVGLTVLVLSIGCRNRGGNDNGNGNGNANANTNGNQNGNDNTGDGTGGALTPDQQTAVNLVTKQLQATSKALVSFVDGFAGVDSLTNSTTGTCPVVTTAHANGIVTASLDYGAGCTNQYLGQSQASGVVSLTYDSNSQILTVTYDSFALEGQSVTGSFSLQLTRGLTNQRTLVGTIDVTTTGIGSATGDITIDFDIRNDTITLVSGTLTLTDDAGASYGVQPSGLKFQPITNGNFVPDAGTVTFDVPNTAPDPAPATLTIVVTFDSQSPVDGTVQVKVGIAPPVEYQIPGV